MATLTRRQFLIIVPAAIAACSVAESTEPPVAAERLAVPGGPGLHIMSGRFQLGEPGQRLAPLVVRLADENDVPIAGVQVSFAIVPARSRQSVGMTGADGSLEIEQATTDQQGLAQTIVTLSERTGKLTVECRLVDHRGLSGQRYPVRFELWSYPAPTGSQRRLCLLSINDFHMHLEPWGDLRNPRGGIARLATALKALRAANDAAGIPTVVFNAGDDIENTLFSDEPGVYESVLLTWDRVGVDFWQIGNHEFHFGLPFIADKIIAASGSFAPHHKGHPMVITWGNVDPSTLRTGPDAYADAFQTGLDDAGAARLFKQAAVLDVGGVRVGVFGVVTDAAVYTQVVGDPMFFKVLGVSSPDAQGMTFYDPDPRFSPYVSEAIDYLAGKGANIIIANSHAGLGFGDRANIPPGKDEHIAREGIGASSGRAVDAIISGHSHVRLNHALLLDNPAGGKTGIMQAEEGGVFVGRADLLVDTASNEIQWIDSGLVQIDATIPEDPDTADMVAYYAAKIDAKFPDRHDPAAYAATYLSSKERTFSGMGELICSAFLHSLESSKQAGQQYLAMAVPSTYRTDIHPGPVDPDLVYQVLSMHKMDATGTNNDTIATIAFKPGLYNLTFFGKQDTLWQNVTVAQYAIELIHSVMDVLAETTPSASAQLSLDVVQLGGVSYVLDATAPAFQRVNPTTIYFAGAPADPQIEYRLAGAHSIIATMAPVISFFVEAKDPTTGAVVPDIVLPDPQSGQPFTDTGIELWESLRAYLQQTVGAGHAIAPSVSSNRGQSLRSEQPDLIVNPDDITLSPAAAAPGESVIISVRVRNLGEHPARTATVSVYWETTPWARGDDPDGFETLEGVDLEQAGSREKIGEQSLAVPAYPATASVDFQWTVPTDLPAGAYPIEVRLSALASSEIDPHTADTYSEFTEANNAGLQRSRTLDVA